MSIELMGKAWKTELKGNSKLVLLALCDFANDEGICFPSKPTIMAKTCIGSTALNQILEAFEMLGVVTISNRKRANGSDTSNEYQIHHFDICPEKYKKAFAEARKSKKERTESHKVNHTENSQSEPHSSQSEPHSSQSEPLEPSSNHHINHQLKNIKKENSKLVEEYKSKYETNEKLLEILEDFIAYRKQIKKPLKTIQGLRGFVKNIKDVQDAGFNLSQAIETMKEHEWNTIKPEYLKNSNQSKGFTPSQSKVQQNLNAIDDFYDSMENTDNTLEAELVG